MKLAETSRSSSQFMSVPQSEVKTTAVSAKSFSVLSTTGQVEQNSDTIKVIINSIYVQNINPEVLPFSLRAPGTMTYWDPGRSLIKDSSVTAGHLLFIGRTFFINLAVRRRKAGWEKSWLNIGRFYDGSKYVNYTAFVFYNQNIPPDWIWKYDMTEIRNGEFQYNWKVVGCKFYRQLAKSNADYLCSLRQRVECKQHLKPNYLKLYELQIQHGYCQILSFTNFRNAQLGLERGTHFPFYKGSINFWIDQFVLVSTHKCQLDNGSRPED